MLNFKRKINAGADSAITQYFYNADGYFRFVDECRKLGVTVPIVPGIMPIVKFSQLARFSDACGAEIPRWMRKTLEGYGDDSANRCRTSVSMSSRSCARNCSPAARPACISTR